MEDKEWYAEQIDREGANISVYILALKQAVQTETKATIIDICRRVVSSADIHDYYYSKYMEDYKSKSEDNNNGAQ